MGPVARFDGVVDSATGFLGAITDGELPCRPTDGLPGPLLKTTRVYGGGTPGQKHHCSNHGGDASQVYPWPHRLFLLVRLEVLQGIHGVFRAKQLSAGTVARLLETAESDG